MTATLMLKQGLFVLAFSGLLAVGAHAQDSTPPAPASNPDGRDLRRDRIERYRRK